MKIDEQAVFNMLNDSNFYNELKVFLEGVIGDELAKPDSEMNCYLIEECTDILLDAMSGEGNNSAIIIPFVSSERLMSIAAGDSGFRSLSKGARAAIIAAAVATLLVGGNAAIAATTGVNLLSNMGAAVHETLEDWGIIKSDTVIEKDYVEHSNAQSKAHESESTAEEKTDSEEKESVAKSISSPAKAEPMPTRTILAASNGNAADINDNTPSEEKNPVALRLAFSDGFKRQYYWGESLDLSGLTVEAVYEGSESETVPLKDCTVSGYNKALVGTQKILVEYRGAKAGFEITLVKTTDKAQRRVTGVEGTPPEKQVYTTDDKALNLNGLRVRLVYSDGKYSDYYTYNSARIIKNADFSQVGEQVITLRIAELADYSFTIIVNEAHRDNVDNSIKSIRLNNSGSYTFGKNQKLEEINCNIYIDYYEKSRKNEVVSYREHMDEIEVYNLDTSEYTTEKQRFTIVYRGHTLAATYMVVPKKTIRSAEIKVSGSIFTTAGPKFLYYKGEPLGYDMGDECWDTLEKLKSYNLPFEGYSGILKGYNFSVKVTYIEDHSIVRKEFPCYNCDYVGYDPYQEGYQTVDIYTKDGDYLTSYNVFVYGDEGYAPMSRPPFEVVSGKEDTAFYKQQLWAKCIGDGELSIKHPDSVYASHDYVEAPSSLGSVSCFAELPDGTRYTYNLRYAKMITACEFVGDSDLLYINLNELDTFDFGDRKLILTFSDGTTEEFYLNDILRGYCYIVDSRLSTTTPLTQETGINSVIAEIGFGVDRSIYSGGELIKTRLPAYVYRDGYRDSLKLLCGGEYLESGAYYDTTYTNKNFLTSTDFYLTAYDNELWYGASSKGVTVEGVEWGTVGDYTAVITVNYNGVEFTANQEVHIVDKVYKPECRITYDPNDGRAFLPDKEIDISGIEIEYIDRLGNVTPISEDDITYEITVDGSGHRMNKELYNEWCTVIYRCTLPDGRMQAVGKKYKTGFCIDSKQLKFFWSEPFNGVAVSFNEVEGAEYYIVEFFGEKYRLDSADKYYLTYDGQLYETETPFVICNRGLADGTYTDPAQTMVRVTAYGKNENGEETKGRTVGLGTSRLIISGYVPIEE